MPAPRDVTVAVRRRLAEPAPRSLAPLAPGWARWSTLVAGLAAVVAVAFALVPRCGPQPATCSGCRRRRPVGEPAAPAPPVAPLPSQREVDAVAAAQRSAAFPIGVPERLGAPDRVLVADGGRVVSLLYGVRTTRSGSTSSTARWTQCSRRWSAPLPRTWMSSARTGCGSASRQVTYVGRDGRLFDESARLSGATLIWRRATSRTGWREPRTRGGACDRSIGAVRPPRRNPDSAAV